MAKGQLRKPKEKKKPKQAKKPGAPAGSAMSKAAAPGK